MSWYSHGRLGLSTLASASLLLGCYSEMVFECTEQVDCLRGRERGRCEASGFCSFAADECPSGWRYGAAARSDLAGRCVPSDTSSTGGTGTTTATLPNETSGTSTDSDASSSEVLGTEESSGSSSDTSGSDTTEPVAICGDGILAPGEACDEPNGRNADGCNEDCTVSGSLVWSRSIGGTAGGAEDLFGIAVAPDGRAFVTGSYFQVAEQSDLWVQQFEADGSAGWDYVIDGSAHGNDSGLSIALMNESIYVAGVVSLAGVGEDWWVRTFSLQGAGGWSSVYGNMFNDAPRGVAVDAAEHVFVAGRSEVAPTNTDIMVKHLVEGGAEDWSVTHGGFAQASDGARALALTPTGGVVIAGYTTVFGQGLDAWISLRSVGDGEPQWTREVQGPAGLDELASGVAVDDEGWIYAVGYEQPQLGDSIGWLRRWDAAGNESWTRTWDGGDDAALASFLAVAVDGSGQIVVAGWEETTDRHGLLRKYDTSGNLRWTEMISDPAASETQLRAVAIGPNDHIWAAGRADYGPNGDGFDGWVVRVAP